MSGIPLVIDNSVWSPRAISGNAPSTGIAVSLNLSIGLPRVVGK